MDLKIKTAPKKGKGVFTNKPIQAGRLVCILTGDRLTARQMDRRIEAGQETTDDPFQISRTLYLDLDEVPRSINHSCDPNCGIRQENKLFAIRDIKAGEEITFDYSTTVPCYKSWWKMRCRCGAKICRRVASSYNTIPKKQQNKYLALHVVPLWVRKYPSYHDIY